jgi:hypothetical protein
MADTDTDRGQADMSNSSHPDDSEIERAAAAWLSCQGKGERAPSWVHDLTDSYVDSGQNEAMWRFVLRLCARVSPGDVETIDMIGVGPLYDMISAWPDATLGLIEAEVATNPTLLRSLSVGITSKQPERQRLDAILARYGEVSG